jgi:hypothetical protein
VTGDEEIVRGLLSSSGITPDPDEVDQLIAKYPVYREIAAAQYRVPEALEELPDLVLDVRT